MKVLFVDDDPSVLKQDEIFLEEEDERLDVEKVVSAERGLELLEENDYDAIVSDYQNPDIDVLEFLKILREKRDTDNPFIVFTGEGREDDAMDALNIASILIDSEEKLERQLEAMESTMDGLAILNEDEEYTYLNQAHAKIYGYDNPDELVGETWRMLYDEKEQERFENEIMPKIRNGENWRGEALGKKKDGSKFPQEVSLTPLDDGGLICVVRDITQRKEIEKSQRLIESSLNQASIEIYWITPEGKFVFVNDKVEEKLGYSEDELTEMHVWDVDPNHGEDLREERWEKLKKEKVLNFETEHKTKDGEIYPVEITNHYLEFDGEEYEFAFAIDITERKEAQEREDFLHSLLRHDLKNKAQVVMGYLEKLKDFDLPEKAEIYLEEAIETTDNERKLIEKVRGLRRVEEEGKNETEISSILKQLISEYEEVIAEQDIELEYDVDECKVQGGTLLEELFSNLIENSIAHSECDKIIVSMDERDDECVVSIIDDGKGITDEKKERIFDRGFKEGGESGFGLGLFLVKRIIENYDGNIEVRDSEYGGARFDVFLNKV